MLRNEQAELHRAEVFQRPAHDILPNGGFHFAEAKDVVRSVKFCMGSNFERVFTLGGHADTRRSCDDRSLHSGNVLPRPDSLTHTVHGSIDLTDDSAEGLTELESKQLPGDVTISETAGASEARRSKAGGAIPVKRSPFQDEPTLSAEEVKDNQGDSVKGF